MAENFLEKPLGELIELFKTLIDQLPDDSQLELTIPLTEKSLVTASLTKRTQQLS